MGMTDQRGEWRRVVTDGQRQAQGQGQRQGQGPKQGEPSLPVKSWDTAAAGEQRGIRLLSDSGAGRGPARGGSAPGRPAPEAIGPGSGIASGGRSNEDSLPRDRVRRLRDDEAHAPRPLEPQRITGRVPGPLSGRVAQRHNRSASPIGSETCEPGCGSAGDDHNSPGVLAS